MKKSLKKQAVFPVLMLLVVTALALIGSSFAWFSMASTAKVQTITGTVEDAGLGLMISQDAENFTSTIQLGDTAKTFVNPATLHQVSSSNGKSFWDAEILAKDANGIATSIKTTANDTVASSGGRMFGKYNNGTEIVAMTISNAQYVTTAGVKSDKNTAGSTPNLASYMVFDLFFQAENAGKLYLDKGTELVAGEDQNADKAIRVAFISYSTAENGTAAVTETTEGITTIWEPNPTETEPSSGVYVDTYGVTSAGTFVPYTNDATYTAKQIVVLSDKLFNSTTAWNTDSNAPTADIQHIATLAKGVTKVRVVVWLEGNDPDCVSTVAQNTISLTLNFFAKKN